MKKKLNFEIIALLMLCLFAACSSDNDSKKAIEIAQGQQLSQTVYANETQGESNISFTTTDAWTSSVANIITKTSEEIKKNEDWVSIVPDHGNQAGTYDIAINIMPNYSGEKRSAIITINCKGERIEINITQDAIAENGEKPTEKDDYKLGFIILEENGHLYFADETGNMSSSILTLKDTCDLSLCNYNDDTKEVYIHRYKYFSSTIPAISEFLSINTQTKETKTLVKNLPSYDYAEISADGRYIVYDKIYTDENREEIIKYSLTDRKEVILYDFRGSYWGGPSIRSISKDGSIVILTMDNKIIVMEESLEKYNFTDGNGDYISAFLSPKEDKLLIQYGRSGLKTCNLDGSNKEIINNNDSDQYIESLLWSIDEEYIYIDNYNKPNHVYKIDIKERESELLTNIFPTEYLYDRALSIRIKK